MRERRIPQHLFSMNDNFMQPNMSLPDLLDTDSLLNNVFSLEAPSPIEYVASGYRSDKSQVG